MGKKTKSLIDRIRAAATTGVAVADKRGCGPCQQKMLAAVKAASIPPKFDGKIAVIINTANEGGRLRATVENFRHNLRGNDVRFVIVADGVTDGCCDDLGSDVTVIRNATPVGCGRAKVQATAALTGFGDKDVAMYYDAHCAVGAGWLAEAATEAVRTGGIVCPLLAKLEYAEDWSHTVGAAVFYIPNDRNLGPGHGQYVIAGDQHLARRIVPRVGVGLGVTITIGALRRLGGWAPFPGICGEQEGGMTRRAWFTATPVHILATLRVGHEFRKARPYDTPGMSHCVRNRWFSYFTLLGAEAFERHIQPLLMAEFDPKRGVRPKHGLDTIQNHDTISERNRFAPMKQRADAEYLQAVGIDAAPRIHAVIPYKPGKQLGAAYNETMKSLPDGDWALFVDHDVLLLNPKWHDACQEAIAAVGTRAGIITCWTNNIAAPQQRLPDAPSGHDIEAHKAKARELYAKHGSRTTDVTQGPKLIGGFFMLVSKVAWLKVGGFCDGFLGVDNDFHGRVFKAGLRVFRIDGLYCYHIRPRGEKPWVAYDPKPKRRVIYTANVGGKDHARPAPGWPGWDYVYITDDPNADAPGWEVRVVKPDANSRRRLARHIKTRPHEYLPEYDYSVWVDANMVPKRDVAERLAAMGWPDFATARHDDWKGGVAGECKRIVSLGKAPEEVINKQLDAYRADGLNVDGCMLYANGMVCRRHNAPHIVTADEMWSREIEAHSTRDQVSLPHVQRKTGLAISTFTEGDRAKHFALAKHVRGDELIVEAREWSWYTKQMAKGAPFAFARYGDGEWSAIFGKVGKNCDGATYTPALGEALRESIKRKHRGRYFYAMQPMAHRVFGAKIEKWMRKHFVSALWHNADAIHKANAAGELGDFVNLLRARPSVIVAPAGHATLDIGFDTHVVTPPVDAYGEIDRIVAETLDAIERLGDPIVCFCMGMAAEVATHRVWSQTQAAWLIDVGSAFDVGLSDGVTRRYFSGISEDAKARNFAQPKDGATA